MNKLQKKLNMLYTQFIFIAIVALMQKYELIQKNSNETYVYKWEQRIRLALVSKKYFICQFQAIKHESTLPGIR